MTSNNNNNIPSDSSARPRRGSFTTQTFNNIFGRSNSTSSPFPGPAHDNRRRMSISTLGLSGASPTQTSPFTFGPRRRSDSTDHSDSIDESAIDDDDSTSRSVPATPFTRRMSFGAQAFRSRTTSGSPGGANGSRSYSSTAAPKPSSLLSTIPAGPRSGGEVTPPQANNTSQASTQSKPRTTSDFPVSARPGEGGGFNWSEQLRSRAESSVSQTSVLPSPPPLRSQDYSIPMHDRAKNVTEMPTPPMAIPRPTPPRQDGKPDAMQERILKGDFYMD